MKRAQAAMEFLMTYGWAILVVLAAIGALAYFGVLSPGKLVPDRCQLTGPGFEARDCKVTDQAVYFSLYNGLGEDIANFTITVNTTSGSAATCNGAYFHATSVPQGAKSTLVLLCDGTNGPIVGGVTDVGSRFDGNVIIQYQRAGADVTNTVTGKIQRKIELE